MTGKSGLWLLAGLTKRAHVNPAEERLKRETGEKMDVYCCSSIARLKQAAKETGIMETRFFMRGIMTVLIHPGAAGGWISAHATCSAVSSSPHRRDDIIAN